MLAALLCAALVCGCGVGEFGPAALSAPQGEAKPKPTPRTGRDGAPLVPVKKGEYPLGGDPQLDDWDQLPARSFRVKKTFFIQKYEVTNWLYARFLNSAGYRGEDPTKGFGSQGRQVLLRTTSPWCHIRWDTKRYIVDAGWEDHPVVCVTWFGATAYAKFYRMKLPSEEQWEVAARGAKGNTFPWGNTWRADRLCWALRPGPASPPTVAVGSIGKRGESWCGAADMAGNVAEWTRSPCDVGLVDGSKYVIRGGSWLNDESQRVLFHGARRAFADADEASPAIGFRCVK